MFSMLILYLFLWCQRRIFCIIT